MLKNTQDYKFTPLTDLVKQAGDLIESISNYISSGLQNVSREDYDKRINECKSCDKYSGGRCSICNCFMKVKAWMATATCPHPDGSKWPKIELPVISGKKGCSSCGKN